MENRSTIDISSRSEAARSHHRILSVSIKGGFLDGARLEFSDGLNCIIGGCGTGKTTVLEFIRYILGMLPDGSDARPRVKATQSHVRTNLGSGTITLDVETKHGTRYRAERPWGDDVQVLDQDGNPVAVSLDRDLVFKADIYSQNEIEEIATNPKFQLALIDKFAEEPIRIANAEIQKVQRAIEQNSLELRNFDHRIREIQEVVPELEVVNKRLQEMQAVTGADAHLINAAHEHKALRAREVDSIRELRELAKSTATRFSRFADAVVESFANASGEDCRAGPNGPLFEDIKVAIDNFTAVFTDAVPKLRNHCDALVSRLDEAARDLGEAHVHQEQEYRQLIAHSEQERQHAAERTRLQQRHLELTRARHELDGLRQKRNELEANHRNLNSRLSDLRDERFRLRRDVAERLSAALAPMVRVTLTQAADKSGYETLLKEMLKGCGLQYARLTARMVESLSPEELSRIVRRGDASRLAEDGDMPEDQASRIIAHLQDSDQIGRLETIDLGDEPLIALKDGSDFKNSADLSTGQRCTVILPILLFESDRPLLIDQPEDNLDNAFVYDTIVKSLREVKASRQLIFVTHNPNIPVLGEAERVFVFASDGRQGTVSNVGTVEEVKGQIEHLLEGGKEAFVLRMQKYGH